VNGFLLDTNIPSELISTNRDPRVENWVYAQNQQSLYLSAVSIGELRRGIVILPVSKRRTHLEQWLERELMPWFRGRILPVTAGTGNRWGILDGERRLKGTPLGAADGMIAATALEHDLTLVTRNVKDFAGLGLVLLNPWEMV
jgi:predicted nucleic acid-binding protein